MIERLTRLVGELQQVVQDPHADPQKTVLVIGIGVVLVLILVAVALALATSPPKRQAPRPQRRVVGGVLVTGLILLGTGVILGFDEAATSPAACVRCHETKPAVASWQDGLHAETDCLACHSRPGLTGVVATRLIALDNTIEHFLDDALTREPTPVHNAKCLSCHDVREGTLETGTLRVRHAEILEAGGRCTRCHPNVGHFREITEETDYPSSDPGMEVCLVCHDGRRAGNDCSRCHLSDIAVADDIPADYPRAQLEQKITCEGCHSLEGCRDCHRLPMPHPEGFATAQGHARLAAFEGKDQICLRCHQPAQCLDCHTGVSLEDQSWGHPAGWRTEHARGDPERCERCHGVENYCNVCHQEESN